jgi:hypothetical protein
VPEKGEAALSLAHDPPGGLYAELIEAAAREVPDRIEAASIGLDRADAVLLTIADGGQHLTLRPELADGEHILDLFAEGPERWLFGAPRQTGDATRHELVLPLLDRPKRIDRATEIPFTLTILTDLRAVETMVVTRPTA